MAEQFEINAGFRRHSKKEGENISVEGRDMCHKEADKIFKELVAAPINTIYYITPSSIGRAQQTADYIGERLARNIEQNPQANIVMFLFGTPWRHIDKARKEGKKVIISAVPEEQDLAFSESEGWMKALRAGLKFEGKNKEKLTEADIMCIWVARKSEIPALKALLRKRYPGMTDEEFDQNFKPSRFKDTPEEIALRQIKVVLSTAASMQRRYPDAHLMGSYVGHSDMTDMATMAILYQEINLVSMQAYGQVRAELETDEFQIKDGQIVKASFRVGNGGRSLAAPLSVDALLKRLQVASETRKAEWATM